MEVPVIARGKSINLTLVTEEDVNYLWKWINDPDINKYLRFPNRLFSKKDEMEWIEDLRKHEQNQKVFIIRSNEDNLPVGNIGLQNIDTYNMHAELGYLLQKQSWGKGYATEAVSLMLQYGFNVLNLRKIYAFVKDGNIGSVKVLQKNGFIGVGRFREHDYIPYEGFRDLLIFEKFREKEINK